MIAGREFRPNDKLGDEGVAKLRIIETM